MKQRVLYLCTFYLLTVVLFMAAKVGFMLFCSHNLSAFDYVQVLWHGITLDLSTALYFLIVPFLLTLVSLWVSVPQWLFRIYDAVAAVLMSLAFVADTSLYPFWHFKLDASCLQYLDTPTEAMASVSVGYLIVWLVALVVLIALIMMAYLCLKSRFSPLSLRSRLMATLCALLMMPLIVIGIRGGLDESTTNVGQVYFSQNAFLNHSAVNPVFSFLASFEKTASNHVTYHFMDDQRCRQLTEGLYNTESVDCDSLLTTTTPNIIVVLLEGCGTEFLAQGGHPDVMPNLNRLIHEGVFFSNCYANSWRTDRGTVCTWSGYPSFPTMSVMKMPAKTRALPNIARTLKTSRNYTTSYIYGGDINFTNMRSYLVAGGFEMLTWKKDYSAAEQRSARWGVCDEVTFQTLYHQATTLTEPFLIGYSTLSSHEPWDVPIKHFDDEILNSFYYLDQCLGRFVSQFRKSPRWQNTLLVLLPDHGIPYGDLDETTPLKNQIPLLWLGGVVRRPVTIDVMCNQTDLAATLLSQLGLPHDDYPFSRDVLSSTYQRPFAIQTYDDGFNVYEDSCFVNYDLLVDRLMASRGLQPSRLIERGKALLQWTTHHLNELGTK